MTTKSSFIFLHYTSVDLKEFSFMGGNVSFHPRVWHNDTKNAKRFSAGKASILSSNFYASVSVCSDPHTYLHKFTPLPFGFVPIYTSFEVKHMGYRTQYIN